MCPIAGGNWNNGANAGVWALNLSSVRGDSSNDVGFRADSVTPRTPQGDGGTKGDAVRRAGEGSTYCVIPRSTPMPSTVSCRPYITAGITRALGLPDDAPL